MVVHGTTLPLDLTFPEDKIPVRKTVEEIFQDTGKMFPSNNRRNSKYNEADSSPNDPGDLNSPHPHILHTQSHRINVRDGNRHSRQHQHQLHKLPEAINTGSISLESLVH